MRRIWVSAVLVLSIPLFAAAATDELRDVATRAVTAYAIGDVAALDAMWSADARQAARRVHVDLAFAARVVCPELKGVAIDSMHDGEVRATAVRADGPVHLRMRFRREGEAWRLTELTVAERAAARELAADPSRWDALSQDDPELLTRELAYALADRGAPAIATARPNEARAATAALAKLAAMRGDALTRSVAASAEAVMADAAGDTPRSKQRATEAVALARQSGDAEALVRALIVQSRADERSPNGMQRALAAMEEAMPLVAHLTSGALATYVAGNSGNLYLKRGRYAEALTHVQRGASLARSLDDTSALMRAELTEGLLLQIEGNHEVAVVHLRRATELGAHDPTNDPFVGQVFITLAQSYTALGRTRESLDALHHAEEIGRRANAPIVLGETHRLLGANERRNGNYAEATRELEEAVATFRRAKRVHFIPGALEELTLTRLDARDYRGAIDKARECADAAREMDELLPYMDCRTFSGDAHHALAEEDAALADFRAAIEASEERRRTLIGDPRQRAHFFAERTLSPYVGAADILASRGAVAEALELAEQARARALLDIVATDVEHRAAELTPEEEQHNDQLLARLAAVNRRLRDAPKEAEAASLQHDIAAARAAYESYQLVLDAAHPRREELQGAVPVAKADELQRLLAPTTAVVEFVDAGDHLQAFVITAKRVVAVRLDGRDLDEMIARFTDALAHRDLGYAERARALYARLLEPLEEALRGTKSLGIVPDGALWRLPFDALMDTHGKFVVESYACFYAPSISVLVQVTRSAPRKGSVATTLLAVGDPTVGGTAASRLRGAIGDSLGPLREAKEEVRALRTLYGPDVSRVYVGRNATKANVLRDAGHARVLHFATHALLDEDNPMYSEVVLAETPDARDDGLLAAWEIMRLDLRADIAVLSACDTARGSVSAGEGVIGFTWALLVAGCPSSVVSQWKVDSASTKSLMLAFHRNLLRSNDGDVAKAQALRTAKLALLRDAKTRHPFYWAAFVLVGSPREMR